MRWQVRHATPRAPRRGDTVNALALAAVLAVWLGWLGLLAWWGM